MSCYTIHDFTVGQEAYVEVIRGNHAKIVPAVVTRIGRKYVYAKVGGAPYETCFEDVGGGWKGFPEKTIYTPTSILYPNLRDLQRKLLKKELLQAIRTKIQKEKELSFEQVLAISEILQIDRGTFEGNVAAKKFPNSL